MRQSSDRAARDAAFRRAIDEAKDNHNISDVVALDRKVRRVGREKVALCPFHEERTPSLRISDAKGTYHCFGCGSSGDIVKYVMGTQGVGFLDAMRWLGAADLPAVDPAMRAKEAAEDEADRAAAIDEAVAIWERAEPAPGTPAAVYLRSRGITMPPPPSIRFGHPYASRDKETGETGPDLPALLAAVTLADETVIGLQRIFLRDGGRAKANMRRAKLSVGRIKGGAVRLGDPHSTDIIITEGPEDALSLAQDLPGIEVFATLGTAMMPFVDYPDWTETICIAGQNDNAGRRAVDLAAAALAEQGRTVRTMFPAQAFKDWNDQLRGIAR